MLWDDLRTAPRGHMEAAFRLRRKQIVGDCRQLSADVGSYNENNNTGVPIQISFDFTLDLIEAGLADQAAKRSAGRSFTTYHGAAATAPAPLSSQSRSVAVR